MKRMIFYCTTEAELFDAEISRNSLADIRANGFDSIYLEFRNTRAPRQSSRFLDAVALICAEAGRLGLEVVLDAHINQFDEEMIRLHPDVFTDALSLVRTPVADGCFKLEIDWGDPSAFVFENAWLKNVNGEFEEVGSRCRMVSEVSEGGGCAMTRQRGAAITRQEWVLDGGGHGEIFVVRRQRFVYANRDLTHPAWLPCLDRICDRAADFGVAGLVWDEPSFGLGFIEETFPICGRILALYREASGHELRQRMIDLWQDVSGRDSAAVRLQFAEILETGLACFAGEFHRRALEHPGLGRKNPRFFVGIHRTMHEELSDDFRIGSVDYFRHTRALTAGFTDSVFEREDSMVSMVLLARSLAPLSTSGEAWSNSWGFLPTDKHLAYYLRLMGCLGVRWNCHAYHSSLMFGPGYPHHPTWDRMTEHLAAHCGLLEQLEGATPVCDTAIVYNWRSLADFTGAEMHHHRRSMLMATLELTLAQASVRWIAPEQIDEARERCQRIVVLWPNRMPAAAWEALARSKADGLEIVLLGPPASVTETGESCVEAWQTLTGCEAAPTRVDISYGEEIEIAGRRLRLDPAAAVPNWQSNPERCYSGGIPAWELTAGRLLVFWNGRGIGARNGTVTTVTTELAQAPGALAALLPTARAVPCEFIAFPFTRGNEELLSLCARHAQPVTGECDWRGSRIRFQGCLHAILRREAGGRVTVWGEGAQLA